jgi:hypothetical protein
LTESESPKEPAKVEEPKSKVIRFLSHPVAVIVVFVSAIASLLALPLSFYFYYAAKEYPQLTYYVHPVKATVVRAGEASRLTAIIDNRPVETDITAAQIAIWNQGKRTIRRNNILRPIIISTENNTPILEATIRRTSREVTQLALNTDEAQQGRISVIWDILEQNDGGVIQLIYAGNAEVQITADGVVEGQPQIEKLEFTGRIRSPYEQYETEIWTNRPLGYSTLVVGIIMIFAIRYIKKVKSDYRRTNKTLLRSFKPHIEFYDENINWEVKRIETTDRFIADVEKQSEEFKEKLKGSEEGLKLLLESSSQRIANYEKERQDSENKIKEYEATKESLVGDRREVFYSLRTTERLFSKVITVLRVLTLIVFIIATYLLFIAQPLGPPFSF